MRFIVIKAKYIVFAAAAVVLLAVMWSFTSRTVQVFNVNGREIPIYCVERGDNKIALTFDCAWNDDDIDEILDILDEYECKATFFVVGDWAQKYGDSLLKIKNRGHEIGNHSYNHADYTKLSSVQIDEDLAKCDSIIEEITGSQPKLVRAPSGGYNNTVIQTCEGRGDIYIQWSVDGIDYGDADPDGIYRRVCSNIKAGDIILLHNGTKYTAKVLPQILEKLTKSYELVTVPELIYTDNYIIDHTGCQKKAQ
ncbi:MAG: polysaccharide deacetylase family protein [Clostridiales bacterium]|nr:polysaccharide deacetylase family protein [Clostridiales bacterium]